MYSLLFPFHYLFIPCVFVFKAMLNFPAEYASRCSVVANELHPAGVIFTDGPTMRRDLSFLKSIVVITEADPNLNYELYNGNE